MDYHRSCNQLLRCVPINFYNQSSGGLVVSFDSMESESGVGNELLSSIQPGGVMEGRNFTVVSQSYITKRLKDFLTREVELGWLTGGIDHCPILWNICCMVLFVYVYTQSRSTGVRVILLTGRVRGVKNILKEQCRNTRRGELEVRGLYVYYLLEMFTVGKTQLIF